MSTSANTAITTASAIVPHSLFVDHDAEQITLSAWKYLYELGFCLIPLEPMGKKPLVNWKAYQEAQPSWSKIELWQRQNPEANIGIVTGIVSGIFVVDFDSEEAFQTAKDRGLAHGVVAKSGRGYHVYYRHPEWTVKTTTEILADVDIRSDGGYIVAPPSIHENGTAYEWIDDPSGIATAYMPEWLSSLLADLPDRPPLSGPR